MEELEKVTNNKTLVTVICIDYRYVLTSNQIGVFAPARLFDSSINYHEAYAIEKFLSFADQCSKNETHASALFFPKRVILQREFE